MGKGKKRRTVYVVFQLLNIGGRGWAQLSPKVYCKSQQEAEEFVNLLNNSSHGTMKYVWHEIPRAIRPRRDDTT